MKSIGIVCECNPFHGGHEYLIRCARESGADCVVCVMSGYFVQRGEAAVVDAHTRAEILIRGGADAVLELPFPYSAASAEHFARAGVEILDRVGVDELWFGSECGDLSRLEYLSVLADSEEFRTRYETRAAAEAGTARAYFETLSEVAGEDVSCLSNDILGIAYLQALRKRGSSMKPVTVRRKGSAYTDETLGRGFPSATALRRKWREEGLSAILPSLPRVCADVLMRDNVDLPADLRYAERLILGHFRLTPADGSERCAELSGGLGARMARLADSAATLDEFLTLTATKKYPNARILRGILFALTETASDDLRSSVAYAHLLAANATGRRFLSETRKKSSLPIVTRRTDLPTTEDAARQEERERRALALYALCHPSIKITDLWKRAPVIL